MTPSGFEEQGTQAFAANDNPIAETSIGTKSSSRRRRNRRKGKGRADSQRGSDVGSVSKSFPHISPLASDEVRRPAADRANQLPSQQSMRETEVSLTVPDRVGTLFLVNSSRIGKVMVDAPFPPMIRSKFARWTKVLDNVIGPTVAGRARLGDAETVDLRLDQSEKDMIVQGILREDKVSFIKEISERNLMLDAVCYAWFSRHGDADVIDHDVKTNIMARICDRLEQLEFDPELAEHILEADREWENFLPEHVSSERQPPPRLEKSQLMMTRQGASLRYAEPRESTFRGHATQTSSAMNSGESFASKSRLKAVKALRSQCFTMESEKLTSHNGSEWRAQFERTIIKRSILAEKAFHDFSERNLVGLVYGCYRELAGEALILLLDHTLSKAFQVQLATAVELSPEMKGRPDLQYAWCIRQATWSKVNDIHSLTRVIVKAYWDGDVTKVRDVVYAFHENLLKIRRLMNTDVLWELAMWKSLFRKYPTHAVPYEIIKEAEELSYSTEDLSNDPTSAIQAALNALPARLTEMAALLWPMTTSRPISGTSFERDYVFRQGSSRPPTLPVRACASIVEFQSDDNVAVEGFPSSGGNVHTDSEDESDDF